MDVDTEEILEDRASVREMSKSEYKRSLDKMRNMETIFEYEETDAKFCEKVLMRKVSTPIEAVEPVRPNDTE